jgi:transcriptional regulator with XRE-family HTH domain
MPKPPTPAKTRRVTIDAVAMTVLREKGGHTLTSLATQTGYSVGYINDLEKGRRAGNGAVIRAVAGALNVPASMLEARPDAA